jgi:hypothetical protein
MFTFVLMDSNYSEPNPETFPMSLRRRYEKPRGTIPTEAASGPCLSVRHCLLYLVREDRQVTGDPVKHVALVFVRCEVADQGTFGCVFAELFDLSQVILHRRLSRFLCFASFNPGTSESQIKPQSELNRRLARPYARTIML